jgi:uncharacterized protein YecT (DUF1311 family)
MAVLLLQRKGPDASLTATTSTAADTGMQAAGDVALRSQRIDSSMVVTPPAQPVPQPMPVQVMPAPVVPQQAPPQAVTPQMTLPPSSVSPIAPPETRRSEPPKTTEPALRLPVTPAPGDSAATKPATGEVCASPAAADQHTCLMNAIDRNDVPLNRVYRQLIGALRRQANVGEGDPDPDVVTDLREAQRKWVDERDAACRDAGDGPLYARARAECFAEQSAKRTRELQRRLDEIPMGDRQLR